MSNIAQGALQQALITLLSADATLAALATGGVHDSVPQSASLPYVALAADSGEDISALGKVRVRRTLSLACYSRQGGRKEASDILNRVQALLNAQTLSVSGFTCISLRAVSSDIRLQSDGVSYRGTLQIVGVLEEV